MDLKNYKVFLYTDKQLRKKHSAEVLDKYYTLFAYLYQNGFDVNCEEDEIEEQLMLYNYFNTEEDLEDLRKINKFESEYEVGKKIVSEEIYDIIKNSKFCHKNETSITIIKSNANIYWKNIIEQFNRIKYLFNTFDSEIVNVLNKFENYEDILIRIDTIEDKISKEFKLLSWNLFVDLINVLYSIYIKLSKVKTDVLKFTSFENINDEIYGSGGGFNSITKEIKTSIIGGTVVDIKTVYQTSNISKIKEAAKIILKENKSEEIDNDMLFLDQWVKNGSNDNERARRIVVNCLLNGCLTLLMFKHNLNFLEDEKNSFRADGTKEEFTAILKHCGIDKEYLL